MDKIDKYEEAIENRKLLLEAKYAIDLDNEMVDPAFIPPERGEIIKER